MKLLGTFKLFIVHINEINRDCDGNELNVNENKQGVNIGDCFFFFFFFGIIYLQYVNIYF